MPEKHQRRILIVDDEDINRQLLAKILADYDILFAKDGLEALKLIRENKETLSLIMLDLLMPQMSGLEVLQEKKKDKSINNIPVIVLTSDNDSEVVSLNSGAVDFIPKPYPQPAVIQARVLRSIELYEDSQLISTTERDPLSGLYNKEFFYRYCQQYDQYNPDKKMDAALLDICHFHVFNERFGNSCGDQLLMSIAEILKEMLHPQDGMICRVEADTFITYTPEGVDYDKLLTELSRQLSEKDKRFALGKIRMGVYYDVDKTLAIERRFDRAKMAADTLRGIYLNQLAVYNEQMHEQELLAQSLIVGFNRALEQGEFEVYYQPKFDITGEQPVLTSAEALIRWNHPERGMISPGIFVPLFEENGLISRLDRFVWETAARQISAWKKKFGVGIPVSVNVSRIDMFDPQLDEVLKQITTHNGLANDELLLEITESAYTRDSKQIIKLVNSLRETDFRIEMDDFGSGYSSLNMISELPIDVLKLDMLFIKNAFGQGKDTGMIRIMLEIADYLGVPVIAEGVETKEQLDTLKEMGCDVIQGYYFSKPVPAREFERFIEEKIAMIEKEKEEC